MPVHDQGYRRYSGPRRAQGAWRVIARAGLRARLRERRFLALLALGWLVFVVRAIQLYLAANVPQAAALLAPSPQLFRDFLGTQGFFVFFMSIYAGAGLIADDRRANALPIYLSKPLTRLEYVVGKLAILVVLLVAVTWLPAMLLLAVHVLFAGDTAFVRAHPSLVPAITGVAAVQVLVAGLAMLALSALSTSGRFAGVLYAGIFFFSAALFQVLRRTTGGQSWAWLSPRDTIGVIADALFGVPAVPALPLPAAVLAVLVLLGAACWVLERRVRAVDVG